MSGESGGELGALGDEPGTEAAPVLAAAGTPQQGRVAAFDEGRGLGTVAVDGGAEYGFHCTAISDGSRTVEVGADVAFTVGPGHLGAWEATAITKS